MTWNKLNRQKKSKSIEMRSGQRETFNYNERGWIFKATHLSGGIFDTSVEGPLKNFWNYSELRGFLESEIRGKDEAQLLK